jgi:ubiquinone/menaquinone biosynthesis C-methylase UbiE
LTHYSLAVVFRCARYFLCVIISPCSSDCFGDRSALAKGECLMSARKGWDIISRSYQLKTKISLEDVHYGPISPGELELKLLGNVRDKDVLEVGCGGGQNAIVLAKWGARSVGLDISEEQIRYARKLARKEGVKVLFHVGNMEDLGVFKPESFDIVLSSFAMQYADDILAASQEVFRVLRNAGLFVLAVSHPIIGRGRPIRRGKRRVWAVSDYFDRRKRVWKWRVEDGTAEFRGRQITIQDYFELLAKAGFTVERVLEPEPYAIKKMSEAELEKIPYSEAGFLRDYDLWRKVPYTIIFKTSKNLACATDMSRNVIFQA